MGEPAFHLTTVFASKDLLGRDVKQVNICFRYALTFFSPIKQTNQKKELLIECVRKNMLQGEEVFYTLENKTKRRKENGRLYCKCFFFCSVLTKLY